MTTGIKRALVIAGFYPPLLRPRTIQAQRVVRALQHSGLDVRVIAESGVYLTGHDEPAVSRNSGRSWQDKFGRAIAEIGLYFPLPRLSWLRLLALLKQALQDDWQPDCVFSMSVPFDSHKIGNKIAKKLHILHTGQAMRSFINPLLNFRVKSVS